MLLYDRPRCLELCCGNKHFRFACVEIHRFIFVNKIMKVQFVRPHLDSNSVCGKAVLNTIPKHRINETECCISGYKLYRTLLCFYSNRSLISPSEVSLYSSTRIHDFFGNVCPLSLIMVLYTMLALSHSAVSVNNNKNYLLELVVTHPLIK